MDTPNKAEYEPLNRLEGSAKASAFEIVRYNLQIEPLTEPNQVVLVPTDAGTEDPLVVEVAAEILTKFDGTERLAWRIERG